MLQAIRRRIQREGVLRALKVTAVTLLPRVKAIDTAIAYQEFIKRHRRLPQRRLYFNDYLFQVRTSGALLAPEVRRTSDKYLVKEYVSDVIGTQFNVPTLKILHTRNEILSYDFPEKCCVKPTHSSGYVFLRHAGEPVPRKALCDWLAMDYYAETRIGCYKNLEPKVIVEPLLTFNGAAPADYKIFCWHGRPTVIQVDMDRQSVHRRALFTTAWEELPFTIQYPRSNEDTPRPSNLDAMLDAAAQLSRPFEFVRVDLYTDGTRFFVGELTHCPSGATKPFVPRSAEYEHSHLFFSPG